MNSASRQKGVRLGDALKKFEGVLTGLPTYRGSTAMMQTTTVQASVNDAEERVLVLAPRGRDAQVIAQVLATSALTCATCSDYLALMRELDAGAGVAVIAEEALHGADLDILAAWLAQQASWSTSSSCCWCWRRARLKELPACCLREVQYRQRAAAGAPVECRGQIVAPPLPHCAPASASTRRAASCRCASGPRNVSYRAGSGGASGTWELDLPAMALRASRTPASAASAAIRRCRSATNSWWPRSIRKTGGGTRTWWKRR